MYDYSKFKNSAFKNKYEIAFEKGKIRMTYGEISDKINALCNSLFNMGVEGTALILSDDPINLSLTAFALSKYGIKRVVGDSKMPCCYIGKVVEKHNPSVVFAEGDQLERMAPYLEKAGVKKVVTFGKAANIFPSQFEFDDLIMRNDYIVTKTYEGTSEIEFLDKVKGEMPDIEGFTQREGIYVDIPPFCSFGGKVFSELLYQSKKCCILEQRNKKYQKKHKVKFVITDRSQHRVYDDFGCDVYVTELDKKRINNSFIDLEKTSKYLTKISGETVEVSFNGATLVVTVKTAYSEGENISENPKINKIRQASLDVLYPFSVQKFFKIQKKI